MARAIEDDLLHRAQRLAVQAKQYAGASVDRRLISLLIGDVEKLRRRLHEESAVLREEVMRSVAARTASAAYGRCARALKGRAGP